MENKCLKLAYKIALNIYFSKNFKNPFTYY